MTSYYNSTSVGSVPVSLSDAKDFIKIESGVTKDDAVITSMIETAVLWGERYCNIDFRTISYEAFYDSLNIKYERYPYVTLEKSPLQSISSVEISNGGTYSATTDYVLKEKSGFSRVLFTDTPERDDSVAYTIKITFDAGYSTLPKALEQAVLEHVSFLYENRADAPSEPTDQIKQLYGAYRHISGYA